MKLGEGHTMYLQQRLVNVTRPDKWSHNMGHVVDMQRKWSMLQYVPSEYQTGQCDCFASFCYFGVHYSDPLYQYFPTFSRRGEPTNKIG